MLRLGGEGSKAMHRLPSFCCMIIAITGTASCWLEKPVWAQNEAAVERILAKSKEFIDKKKYAEGLAVLNRAIAAYPSVCKFYDARGRIFDSQERYKLAFADFDKAIKLKSPDSELYFKRGWCSDQLGNFAEAVVDYDKYLSFHPNDVSTLCCAADNLLELGQTDKAMKYLNRALAIEPDYGHARRLRAVVLNGKNGDIKQAIADFTVALKETDSGHYGSMLVMRAGAYAKLKDYPHALADYNAVLKLIPEDDNALRQRAAVYEAMGDLKKAVADYSKAIDLSPVYAAPSYVARARCYKKMGRADLAARDIEQSKTAVFFAP